MHLAHDSCCNDLQAQRAMAGLRRREAAVGVFEGKFPPRVPGHDSLGGKRCERNDSAMIEVHR